jgi:hypothetical protein
MVNVPFFLFGEDRAMAWNTNELKFKYGSFPLEPSRDPQFEGKARRPHSVFVGTGLYLDAIGVPSNRMYDVFESEKMRKDL